MEVKRLRTLAIEIFKTINNATLKLIKYIFKSKAKIRSFDIIVNTCKTTNFGNKSLTALSPKIWNSLPTEIKSKNLFKI